MSALAHILHSIEDPIKEIELVRKGIRIRLVEEFLETLAFPLKDILQRLDISASTYFAQKKRKRALLNSEMTEKFLRLFQVVAKAEEVVGKKEARQWIYREIPSLGNQRPIDLLDTEPGHRLVEQALLQIKHGIYG